MTTTVLSASPSQGCTNLKIRQFMRRVSQQYDTELGRAGLKTTQYSLLSYVQKMGPVRPMDLAAAIKMEPSTLTRNLRPLMDAGWVAMQPGPDARSRLVEITDAGRAKRTEAQRHWRQAQSAMNALLGADRLAELHGLIDDYMEKLKPQNVETAND